MSQPYDSVPLGQAGTGAAYILPSGSNAAQNLLDTMDYNQKINAKNQANKLQAAQDLAQSYKDNALKAKNGTLFNSELMGLQQKHIQQGSDYAKQGFDVYNPNPNNASQMAAHDQYMADRAKIYDLQDSRDDISKAVNEDSQLLTKAPSGKYDNTSVQAQHDFLNKNSLQDIVNNGLQVPRIREAFDPEANVYNKAEPIMTGEKEIVTKNGHKITTNAFMPKETGQNISSMFQATPGGSDYVQQQTGLTPQQAQMLPEDLDGITKLNDDNFHSPNGLQALSQMGITSFDDPKYQALLQQKSATDFQNKQKYNALIQTGIDRARAKAKLVNNDVPDFAYAIENRDEIAANQRTTKFNQEQAKLNGTDNQVVYGNQESTVPMIQQSLDKNGKVVPVQTGTDKKGNPIMSNSQVVPQQGATLFTQNFPQTKLTPTPGTVFDPTTGHSVPNTQPFEVTAGSVKMEPVFSGLDPKSNRNGAVMTKKELMDAVQGKGAIGLQNLSFQPMVYGTRPVKQGSKTVYQPVAFPYDAVRGNSKLKTGNFDKTEQQFKQFIVSKDFTSMSAQDRMDTLAKMFNIQ